MVYPSAMREVSALKRLRVADHQMRIVTPDRRIELAKSHEIVARRPRFWIGRVDKGIKNRIPIPRAGKIQRTAAGQVCDAGTSLERVHRGLILRVKWFAHSARLDRSDDQS